LISPHPSEGRYKAMLRIISAILTGLLLAAVVYTQTINTVAGGGPNNLPSLTANLNNPSGVAADGGGNLYVASQSQHRVFKVDTSGQLTVVAGVGLQGFSGDGGPATSASLNGPSALAIDGSGNLFIADVSNNRIRKVDLATGVISTVAGNGFTGFSGDGGPATSASMNNPAGVAVDGSGNLFIAEQNNMRVRKVNLSTGIIMTVAGNGFTGFSGDGGPATSASLGGPFGVAVDGSGNLFIANRGINRIRKVILSTGIITTVAGNGSLGFSGDGGPATSASLNDPLGVAVDGGGNLFITDRGNHRVRMVNLSTGTIMTVAGNGFTGFSGDGGSATSASINNPVGVAVDGSGNLLIADVLNNRIRRVILSIGIITTVAGNGFTGFSGDGGPATSSSLANPIGVIVHASNLFFTDRNNHRIRKVDLATGIISTVAGNGLQGFTGDGGAAIAASLNNPGGLAVDGSGNLFFADQGNHRARRVHLNTGIISTVAGNGLQGFTGDGGQATLARLNNPAWVTVDGSGNLFIADQANHRVRRVILSTGVISTFAGNGSSSFGGDGGLALSASLGFPSAVAIDGSGNLLITHPGAHRIRKVILTTGIISTVVGSSLISGFGGDGGQATSARLAFPSGVVVDGSGNMFIADQGNQRVRRVDLTGVISTVAGNGSFGFSGDGGPPIAARFANPTAIAVDGVGNLYITDQSNHRIRKVVEDATPPAIILNGTDPMTIECHSAFTDPGATATDNLDGDLTTQITVAGTVDPFTPGSYNLTYSVTDAAGNLTSLSRTVNVVDTTPPMITAPPDVTVYTGPEAISCSMVVNDIGIPLVSDNCGGVSITSDGIPSGNIFPVGTTTISWLARDANGNISTTTQTVTVIDNTPPVIACSQAIRIDGNISGQCSANLNPGAPGAGDNCELASVVGVRSDGLRLDAPYPLGLTTIIWTATDVTGNTSVCVQEIEVTNPIPVAVINGPSSGALYPVGSAVSFAGSYTDNAGGTHTAQWTFVSGTQTINLAGTVNETTGVVSGSNTFASAGVYLVTLKINDGCGGSGTTDTVGSLTAMVVIYDPDGGFVTGGGWIDSPAGAYVGDPSLTGRASLGFVSKYQRGATVPTGNTEFQFRVANFNFKSASYEWLVVSGARAQYKGTGTINGAGNYGFILTAIDGQLNGGGGMDKFRIKIWDKNNQDAIVYDNQLNAPDTSDPTTVLGGGSIVIHR
jgi:sugar lactone lactonase YvrE